MHRFCQYSWPEGKGGSVWDQSQKLNNVAAYMGITRDHSLPNLGVCTPLDDLQQELWGDKQKGMHSIFLMECCEECNECPKAGKLGHLAHVVPTLYQSLFLPFI